MESRQLRYFLAIVDHRGMTRAAEVLHVAQPSLSQAITALERELGARLFHRTGRGLVLTPAGEAALEPARRVVADLAEVRAAVEPVVGLRGGRLDLIVQQMLSGAAADVVAEFSRRYPDVVVRMLEPQRPHHVGHAVRSGDCELALCTLPVPDGEGLVARELARSRLHVALPPGSGISDDRDPDSPLDPGELVDTPFVTSRPGSAWRELLNAVLAGTGHEPIVAVEITSQSAALRLVTAGTGAAIVTADLARAARQRGAVVGPLNTDVVLRFGVLHRPGTLSSAARRLLALYEGWAAARHDGPGADVPGPTRSDAGGPVASATCGNEDLGEGR